MLSLTRKRGQRVILRLEDGRRICVAVGSIRSGTGGRSVNLLFDCPRTISIVREELLDEDGEYRPRHAGPPSA